MLLVKDLHCGYYNTKTSKDVLHGITFEVEPSKKVVVLGENGSGKSTLLRAVDNLIKSRGQITLDSHDIRSMSRVELSKNIAFLTQLSPIYYPYTVYETVLMGRFAHIKGASPTKEDMDIALDCIESVGMEDKRDTPINRLSGGQMQKVFLARAMAQKPKLLLLDEPTNHLDLKSRESLLEQLDTCAKDGMMVLMVMHDIALAMSFADKLLLLKEGRAVEFGSVQEISSSDALDETFGIDVSAYMERTLKIFDK